MFQSPPAGPVGPTFILWRFKVELGVTVTTLAWRVDNSNLNFWFWFKFIEKKIEIWKFGTYIAVKNQFKMQYNLLLCKDLDNFMKKEANLENPT